MDLFATHDDIATLEQQLQGAVDNTRLTPMTSIAWFGSIFSARFQVLLDQIQVWVLP